MLSNTQPAPPQNHTLDLQQDVKTLSDTIRSTYTENEVAMASLYCMVGHLMDSYTRQTGRDISHLNQLNKHALDHFVKSEGVDAARVKAAQADIGRAGKTIKIIASLPE